MGGEEVKRKLAARGWNYARLAARIGVSAVQVSRVVLGQRISPFLQAAIAEVVGTSAEELFGPLYWKNFVHQKYTGLRALPPRRREEVPA